jgi:signal transduction histidine kinase
LFAVTLVAEVGAVVLSWGLKPRWDTLLYVVFSGAMTGAGALIASRQPRNPIGWLLCAVGVENALAGDLAQGYGLRAAVTGWPAGTLVEWIATSSWLPQGIALVLTFVLFPDGRLLGRRWLIVVGVAATGVALAAPGWSFAPGTGSEFVAGVNPYAVTALPTGAMFSIGMTLLAAAMVASVVPLVVRFRRSNGVERQQVKWVALAAAVSVVVLPVGAVLWDRAPVVRVAIALALAALPISMCVAILRYRLYDIDLVISRTVAYSVLTVVLAGTYAVAVVVIGAAVGRSSAWATAGATLAVAAAFGPARRRLQDAVDRRFNRARFDALERMSRFLEDLRAGRAAPEDVERVLREALGVEDLEVRLSLPGTGLAVDVSGAPVVDDPGDDGREQWPIRHAGTTLGTVVAPAALAQRGSLVPKVLDAGALAVEVARLRVGLRRQLDEVEASRARIVAAADDERRRIERDLHDGAQQRLVSIGLALRHAQHALGTAVDPDVSLTLDDAVAEISVAIDELRQLAGGLRPAQLDAGLGPALRDLARRVPLPVEVDAAADRFPIDIETAAYFCACEGLTNAVKHANATKVVLRTRSRDNGLVVSVVDDGIGGAAARNGSGLTGLSDRVAARGGTLTIDSSEGCGTTLVAEFPCVS